MTQPLPIADDHAHGFELEPLEFSGPDPAKVVALEQAVDCSRWMDLHDHKDPAGMILVVATRFEEYLLGTPSKED